MNEKTYLHFESSKAGLAAKFRELSQEGVDWFRSEALEVFGKKQFPNKSDDSLIQQTLAKSPNDETRKRNGREFYLANASIFITQLSELCAKDFIENFEAAEEDELTLYNYSRVLRNLLYDSLILLNEYLAIVKGEDARYGVGKGHKQHTLTIYHSLNQSIYGQASFHAFRETQPDLSISIIRQLIELRIRRAFGVLGYFDATTESLQPLPMGRVFEVLSSHKERIDFSMPFDCLVRIYGWSNIFLHTGLKEYSWSPIFVTKYIQTFSLGKSADLGEGWSANSGIQTSEEVLDSVHRDLESLLPKSAEIVHCEPEAVIQASA